MGGGLEVSDSVADVAQALEGAAAQSPVADVLEDAAAAISGEGFDDFDIDSYVDAFADSLEGDSSIQMTGIDGRADALSSTAKALFNRAFSDWSTGFKSIVANLGSRLQLVSLDGVDRLLANCAAVVSNVLKLG